MERAATFFGRAGEIIQDFTRWLILFVRRYPLFAVFYLAVYMWCVFGFANQTVTPPPPLPSAQNPVLPTNTAPAPVTAPPPAPVVPIAQAQALRNGNSIIVRWNRPVSSPSLYADSGKLTVDCQPPSQPKTCTAALPQQASQVEASWSEGGQRVKTNFRL